MTTSIIRRGPERYGGVTLLVLCLAIIGPANSGQLKQAEEKTASSQLAAESARQQARRSVNALSRDIQSLKQSVVSLNKDLRVLQEDLLFPANTRFSVFVSLDVGRYFKLESARLKINGRQVTAYLYDEEERQAMARGGIHRLHVGNIPSGTHTLDAIFTGVGPNGREYKRGATLQIKKQAGPKHIELLVADSKSKQQPEFRIREW